MKRYINIISCLILCVLFSSVSFALDLPSGIQKDEVLSQQALTLAQQQYDMLKQQLIALKPELPPDQQAMIDQAIVIADQKIAQLDHIDVYFAIEATPGEEYDNILSFFQGTLSAIEEVSNEELEYVVANMPPGMLPEPTLNTLSALIAQGTVRGATGTSGKSRVSVTTVYVNPDTMEVMEGTTIVIATNK